MAAGALSDLTIGLLPLQPHPPHQKVIYEKLPNNFLWLKAVNIFACIIKLIFQNMLRLLLYNGQPYIMSGLQSAILAMTDKRRSLFRKWIHSGISSQTLCILFSALNSVLVLYKQYFFYSLYRLCASCCFLPPTMLEKLFWSIKLDWVPATERGEP